MQIETIKESLERLQLLVDKDIIRVRPSDMDEFLSEWRQAMEDIRKALCQQEQAEPVEFTCHGNSAPAYSCNKPGDMSGTYYRHPPSAVPEGYSLVPNEIINFLNGSGHYCGYWFGDKHVRSGEPFWWRTTLRKAIEDSPSNKYANVNLK